MRFDTSQHMRLGQSMKLAPRMIQSMEILAMPLAELEERIEQELESNPTLELAEVEPENQNERVIDGDADRRTLDMGQKDATDDFERLDRYEDENPEAAENEFDEGGERPRRDELEYTPTRRVNDDDRDGKMDAMASAPARTASLGEQLRDQWSLVEVEPRVRELGTFLLGFLEEDGYLKTPLETIADRAPEVEGKAKPTVAELEHALRAMQLFLEPAGIAARTPQECLLLQLDAIEDDTDLDWPAKSFEHARRLVRDHLDDLKENRLPRIAEKTGFTLDEIKEALILLRRLSLHPGRRLVEETQRPIVPDVIVEYDEAQDRYVAYLNDSRMPNLRINQEYALLAKDKQAEKRDREFVKTNLSNAMWLIDAVGQRRQTLLRVVNAVIAAQREFFDFGPQALRPLPMTLVAEQLGIHVATVSRAVAEKYLATPRGIVPLRKFFSGGVQTDDGEEKAWDAIKVALQEVIAAEDKRKPMSDEALVDALKARGIEIARRTIAKYRDQLGIPSARLRKTF